MSNDFSFGYALSTLEGRLLENPELVKQLNDLIEPVVIINQFQKKSIDDSSFGPNVTVINTKTIGISVSRNMALSHSESDFVLICDDDILLIPENIQRMKSSISEDTTIALYWTQLETTSGKLWREDYKSHSFNISGLSLRSRRRIQRINSMEQVVNVNFFKEKKLAYNEAFGLGSNLHPLGEETLLSWSILNSGGVLRYLPIPVRSHPPMSSFSLKSRQNSKAICAIHTIVFWPIGPLIFLAYSVKRSIRSLLRSS
tara:strand:+ start:452 stop:1222 length:771 start_codon:yes stop_codon:yes gene_type:complete